MIPILPLKTTHAFDRTHFHEQFEEVFSCVLGGADDFDQTSRRMSKAVRGNFLEATKACGCSVKWSKASSFLAKGGGEGTRALFSWPLEKWPACCEGD